MRRARAFGTVSALALMASLLATQNGWAETFNLSCTVTSGTGRSMQVYAVIDTDRKYVRIQSLLFAAEYVDGRSGPPIESMPNVAGLQFVNISDQTISFGLKAKADTFRIDRNSAMLTYPDGDQFPCDVRRPHF